MPDDSNILASGGWDQNVLNIILIIGEYMGYKIR